MILWIIGVLFTLGLFYYVNSNIEEEYKLTGISVFNCLACIIMLWPCFLGALVGDCLLELDPENPRKKKTKEKPPKAAHDGR